MALILVAGLIAGCSDNGVDGSKTNSVSNQPPDQNPQIDRDPTAESSTGGNQQGVQPAQPAAPKQ
ncbi:hypothetical protein EN836_27920 [Mesorhizobium sp. M1C.F.Ca.ET.193.01.1.1]|nr:MAG: hypothetical protein EOQ28_31255 [Mesorhizobium sp.]TGQ50733.1 hypothetical protein EN853_27915 [Mesorhizobium sp. M1C.F.Ca.ET.210.01.1.1]TGQ65900.1 hypothetical protein EN855_027925 [Mesorhizobium sp. M1C.F.Ca.ET.212.01.1.1]TGQ99904.1 hypothetical protein EN847_27915 [Mesorhizobium sp. M1C.F.Ca.ET.204.01.1.1]TGR20437.1 hypothetical protein EN839_27915 [Mesorhizobium sp. M1C.F.Ca.ET.196.01.1.1]TGR43113.1 hypothetical protein EN838_27915 [Mesorhizobium sp. M1C.F.Ca.ET.195.01.1.1]TGR616